MIKIGLTGSIGMGKTTVSHVFEEFGAKIIDADKICHDLSENEAKSEILSAFPEAVVYGELDRDALFAHLVINPYKMKQLEKIMHPFVEDKINEIIEQAEADGVKMTLTELPLLFEIGVEKNYNKVVVATCSVDEQKRRVMQRPNMTEEVFEFLNGRQMPDAEKRERADYIVDTEKEIKPQVERIVKELTTPDYDKMLQELKRFENDFNKMAGFMQKMCFNPKLTDEDRQKQIDEFVENIKY